MKIIASDFDGTLYRNRQISERDKEAIKKWQDAGNLFGLVTGRGCGIMADAADLGVNLDFALVDNGAIILDKDGNVLRKDTFDAAIAKEYYDFSYDESGFTFLHEKPDTSKYVGRETQIALLLNNENDARELSAILNEKFGDKLNSFSNGGWINTVAAGVSKATGIKNYSEIRGVCRKNIWVVGDHYNDLSMLQAYDGYIVSTATDGMKKLIPNVCEDIAHLTEIAGL